MQPTNGYLNLYRPIECSRRYRFLARSSSNDASKSVDDLHDRYTKSRMGEKGRETALCIFNAIMVWDIRSVYYPVGYVLRK